MNAILATPHQTNNLTFTDTQLISKIVDVFYPKMLDDYRVNRFFRGRPPEEQTQPLKFFLNAALSGAKQPNYQLRHLLNDYFTAAFARTNEKPSLVNGQDFGFLLEAIGGREIRPITLVCECHSFLMKMLPDDFHYDVVMEHLAETLKELHITGEQAALLMAIGESGRDGLMGRAEELPKDYE
jgi:truncated hemoglobin YjbI